ncbi:ABC transporter [Dietzia sp. SLG310A2-38A2]|uniref:ABC transporter n=1 Tax=Dietzia sp. SLG310A2-38A2 TaxID=1630643 RepID=UPI0015FB3339|nr:ABC transporter [Dietzia sp. SLG310A2-38A2]MBB1032662.1 ABC transporter [Dietzia sp. SLG310A2-38A2]
MNTLRSIAPLGVVVALILTGCAGGPDDPDAATAGTAPIVEESSPQGTGSGHGEIEGAEEVAEPQLHLVSIDRTGAVGMLNLLDGTTTEPGSIDPPTAVTSDGRYLFADTDAGVEIVDSGVWTWDHVDHFHYYRTSPSILGSVPGDGPAIVTTSGNATTGGTGVFFPESGDAVLLSNEALSEGRVEEVFRFETEPHEGLSAPLGGGALVTTVDESGTVSGVEFYGADGSPVDGATAPCADAQGAVTTRIGVVVGCADGAILATYEEGEPQFEHIAFPEGTQAPRAADFRGRKGRPAVAALAGDQGFWLLDTRAREWQFVPTDQPLVQVSAASDDDSHVVAVDRQGRIRVFDGEAGTEIAATDPLLAEAVATPETSAGIELTVDRERAYVNDPVAGVVHEIDYRGDARVARSLETPTSPDFVAETGR